MADVKISGLPASTVPLGGTEVLPIVQSGVTKQVSVANLTAGRAISATELTLTTDNLVIGTSGKGIDFSATPGTGTSELFDDYEEGTWTPTLTTTGTNFTSVTYDALTSGVYTKIGNVVQIQGTIRTDAITVGAASGNVLIGGLPFTAAAPCACAVGSVALWAGEMPNGGEILSTTTTIAILYRAAVDGATLNTQVADCRTTGDSNLIRVAATYRAS